MSKTLELHGLRIRGLEIVPKGTDTFGSQSSVVLRTNLYSTYCIDRPRVEVTLKMDDADALMEFLWGSRDIDGDRVSVTLEMNRAESDE